MTDRESLTYEGIRGIVYARSRGYCEVCGEALEFTMFHMAHRIPQRGWCLKKWGKEVIHHHLNFAATCGLDCNGKVSIAGSPVACDELVERIRRYDNGE